MMKYVSYFLLFLVLGISYNLKAQRGPMGSPEEAYQRAVNNPVFTTTSAKGEGFCWQARGALDQFARNYESTKDKAWLDAGFKYADFLVNRMDVAPDGYKGWIGPFLSQRKYWQDVLVGDALLFEGILDLCIIVNDDPALKKAYGEKIKPYIASAKRDFVEKYDKRDTWKQDGPYGGYVNDDNFLVEGNLKEWINDPKAAEVGVSHPFNKQMDAGLVCAKLYVLTGEKFYHDRAETIFFTAKSHFQYFDDHYCWNYYEPLYPGDIDVKKMDTRHGIWVHPWRSGYQASEVGKIVQAYHYGYVFDETDMKRIINTNLKVMWNGDKLNPKYINSNGLGADGDTIGLAAFQRAYGHSNVQKNGGELWSSLIDFDPTIREIAAARMDKNSPRYAQLMSRPVSFERKYVKGPVKVPEIKFTECKDLYCAVALPHALPKNGNTFLVCKSWKGGDLKIDLYTTKDKLVTNVYSGKIPEGTFIRQWDGKDPQGKAKLKGDYKIRWTINGGYREFPLVLN
jgi:hypothetical protein